MKIEQIINYIKLKKKKLIGCEHKWEVFAVSDHSFNHENLIEDGRLPEFTSSDGKRWNRMDECKKCGILGYTERLPDEDKYRFNY